MKLFIPWSPSTIDAGRITRVTGQSAKQVLQWVSMCDLLRIKGVGPEMVRLFNAARVKTIKQLRVQKAKALLRRVTAANKTKKITPNPPTQEQLGAWIAQAKKLKLVLR